MGRAHEQLSFRLLGLHGGNTPRFSLLGVVLARAFSTLAFALLPASVGDSMTALSGALAVLL